MSRFEPGVRHLAPAATDPAFSAGRDPERLDAAEALAAVIRITPGNFRLMARLLAPIRRTMTLNRVESVSPEVAEAARDCLVIGPSD